MDAARERRNGRVLGWIMMLASIGIMLVSIFTDAIGTAVAVPIGMMFLIFSVILLNGSNSEKKAEPPGPDKGSN